MAVTAATLTTTVGESITLNGKTYGNTITKTHASVKIVREQIITVPNDALVILYEAAASASGQTFDEDLIVYARITNTDASNYIGLHVLTTEGDEFFYKVNPGCSFILNAHADALETETSSGADLTAENFGSLTDADIIKVSADANTAAVDVEVLIAATG